MAAEIRLFDNAGRRLYINAAERAAFLAAAQEQRRTVRTFCYTLHYTGARISEVLALRPSKVDLAERVVIFRSLKKRAKIVHRAVPVPDGYLDALDMVHGLREARRAKDDVRLWPWTRQHAWRLVKAVMAAAGIDTHERYGTAKGLRHGFAIAALAKDVPLPVVQKIMGHADIKTTAIYLDAIGLEQRDFTARMWD